MALVMLSTFWLKSLIIEPITSASLLYAFEELTNSSKSLCTFSSINTNTSLELVDRLSKALYTCLIISWILETVTDEGIPLTNNEIIAISQELDNVLNKYEAQMIIEELLDIK